MKKKGIWTEKQFIDKCLRPKLKELGYYVHKSAERFTSGWPDLVCMKDGRVIFIEVKRDGKEPTPLQYLTLRDIASAGCEALVVDYDNKTDRIATCGLLSTDNTYTMVEAPREGTWHIYFLPEREIT